MRARWPLLLLFLLVGCDGEEPPASTTPEPPAIDAAIELGAGLSEWRPLAEGDPVELVAGFQGGWHVDLSVRGEGLDPRDLWLRYEAHDPQTEGSLSFVTEALLDESNVLATDEGWVRLGDRVVFDISGPEVVVGSEVCLVVTASLPSWTDEERRCVTIVDELP